MKWRIMAACAACIALASAALAHEDDYNIGSTADGGGQLAVIVGTPNPIPLPTVSGLLNGFALDDPGFASILTPTDGLFVLSPTASIRLEVLAVDPDLKAYTPGFISTLDHAGAAWDIGAPDFDTHPTWHIDSDDPDYNPARPFWTMQFRVIDTHGVYSPSDPVTAQFVPEPASAAALAALLARWAARRRATRTR